MSHTLNLRIVVKAFLAAGLVGALAANAQDLPSIDVKFAEKPEKREAAIEFAESVEPVEIALFAADPKLLEYKVAATVAIRWPSVSRSDYMRMYSRGPEELTPTEKLRRKYWAALLDPRENSRSRGFLSVEATSHFKGLVESAPEALRSQPGAKLLLEQNRIRIVRRPGAASTGRPATSYEIVQVIQFLGPDEATVKSMVNSLLTIYDQTLSTPIQELMIADMQGRKKKLPALLEKLKTEVKKAADKEKHYEQFEFITTATIDDLKTQKRLIAVDMAGAKARIEACQKILAAGIPTPKTREQVESIKITAEIELVGLTAQKDTISQIIDDGTTRIRLMSEFTRQERIVDNARKVLQRAVETIEELDSGRHNHRPLNVEEAKIQPIKWLPAENRSGFGGFGGGSGFPR